MNSISKFIYNSDKGITFLLYYRRYEDIFKKDCLHWNNKNQIISKEIVTKNISILFCRNNQVKSILNKHLEYKQTFSEIKPHYSMCDGIV